MRCWGRPRGFAPTGHEPARPGAQRAAQAPAHPPGELPRGARAPGGATSALRRPRARRLPRLWPARGGLRALRVRGLRPDASDRSVVQRARILPALLRPAHDGAGAPPGSARVPGARSREAVGVLASVRAAGSGGVRPRAGAGPHAPRDAGHRVALPAARTWSGFALAARRLGDGAPAIWLRLATQPAPSRLVLGRRLRRRRARTAPLLHRTGTEPKRGRAGPRTHPATGSSAALLGRGGRGGRRARSVANLRRLGRHAGQRAVWPRRGAWTRARGAAHPAQGAHRRLGPRPRGGRARARAARAPVPLRAAAAARARPISGLAPPCTGTARAGPPSARPVCLRGTSTTSGRRQRATRGWSASSGSSSTARATTDPIPVGIDLWGSAADDVWMAANTMVHWDGSSWSTVSGASGRAVWGSASDDVWAVGDSGAISHWDGSSWTPVTSGTDQFLRGVWGAASTTSGPPA